MIKSSSPEANIWSGSFYCGSQLDDPWERCDSKNRRPVSTKYEIPLCQALDRAQQLSMCVEISSDIVGGSPRIYGTRIPVHMVINAVEEYGSVEGALRAYGCLSERQVRDALQFAAHVLEQPE